MSLADQKYESLVVELAGANIAAGGKPAGCAVVDNAAGVVLVQSADPVAQTNDHTAHAPILTIGEASSKRDMCENRLEHVNGSGKGEAVFVAPPECSIRTEALDLFGAEMMRVNRGKVAAEETVKNEVQSSQSNQLASGHLVNEVTVSGAVREKKMSEAITSTFIKEIPARRPEANSASTESMPVWGDAVQNHQLLATVNDKHRHTLAHRGTPTSNVVKDIRELNTLVRQHYAKFITDLGMHIRPVIIASDYEPAFQGVGGTFKLFLEDGSVEHMTPAPPSYQILKSLSHVTLGISSIVLPYLEAPHSQGWQNGLASVGKQIEVIQANLTAQGISLSTEVVTFITDMLGITNDYVKETLKNGFVCADGFYTYTKRVLPHIRKAMANAGRVQVEADLPALMNWKRKLGDKWKDLYVIIPTVWPVAGDNPRERMLAFLLPNPSLQIVKVQNQSTEAELFTTLGRVIGDRSVAAMVFGAHDEFSRDSQLALSTPRDLVSSACADAMVNYLHTCPPDQLEQITANLSFEAISAISAMRASKEPLGTNSPAIASFYSEPMTAQDFGMALAKGSHSVPNGHPPIAANGSALGCPFGK